MYQLLKSVSVSLYVSESVSESLCLQISFNSYTFYSKIIISNKTNHLVSFILLKVSKKLKNLFKKGKHVISTKKNVISIKQNNHNLYWLKVTWPSPHQPCSEYWRSWHFSVVKTLVPRKHGKTETHAETQTQLFSLLAENICRQIIAAYNGIRWGWG